MRKVFTLRALLLLCFSMIIANTFVYAQPQLLWAKGIGGGIPFEHSYGQEIRTDAAGNVYIYGSFVGTADFDPGVSTANLSAADGMYFIVKLDATGNFVWVRQSGGASSFDVDADGNVYVTGFFSGTADLNPGTGISELTANGNTDAYLLKLDPAGNFAWVKNWGAAGGNVRSGYLTTDANGYIYCTGTFDGTVDFDPGAAVIPVTSNGKTDMFVTKFDASGNFIWAKNIGGKENDNIAAFIDVDIAGNIYTGGAFNDTVDFDPGPLTYYIRSVGGNNIFISKLSASGNFVWAKTIVTTTNTKINALTVDKSNNVYTTGVLYGSVDFDPGPDAFTLTQSGTSNAFILKLNTSGGFVWAKKTSGANAQGNAITTDAAGNVFIGGIISSGTIDFDPDPVKVNNLLSSRGRLFIYKSDEAGNFVWARNMGGNTAGISFGSITIDALDKVISTGGFIGSNVDFDPDTNTVFPLSIASEEAGNGRGIFVQKLSQGVPTAVKMSELSGYINENGKSTLHWETYSEQNNHGFNIERSDDGKFFSNVSFVTSKATSGNSEQVISYEFIYPIPTEQQVYYRLKQIDYDNKFYYSNTVRLTKELSANNAIRIYPNPTQNSIYIDAPEPVNLFLFNISGQQVSQNTAAKSISLSGLPNRVYLLRITGQDGKLLRAEQITKQ